MHKHAAGDAADLAELLTTQAPPGSGQRQPRLEAACEACMGEGGEGRGDLECQRRNRGLRTGVPEAGRGGEDCSTRSGKRAARGVRASLRKANRPPHTTPHLEPRPPPERATCALDHPEGQRALCCLFEVSKSSVHGTVSLKCPRAACMVLSLCRGGARVQGTQQTEAKRKAAPAGRCTARHTPTHQHTYPHIVHSTAHANAPTYLPTHPPMPSAHAPHTPRTGNT
jgi:hypothetical protein